MQMLTMRIETSEGHDQDSAIADALAGLGVEIVARDSLALDREPPSEEVTLALAVPLDVPALAYLLGRKGARVVELTHRGDHLGASEASSGRR